MDGKEKLSFQQMRNNLLAAFKGRALRNDKKLSDDERTGINYIGNMDDKKIESIMGDNQLSDTEFKMIMKDGKDSVFANAAIGAETQDMLDRLETAHNKAMAEVETKGALHDIKVTADQQMQNSAKVEDAAPAEIAQNTQKTEAPKEEKGFLDKVWDWATEHPVLATVGAVAGTALVVTAGAAIGGALAGFMGVSGASASAAVTGLGNFVAGAFTGKALTAIALGGVALGTFSACSKDDWDPGKGDTNVIQTVNIKITGNENMETLLDYLSLILAELESGNKANAEAYEKIIQLIKDFIEQDKTNAEEIIRLCGENNELLGTVINALLENNELLKKNNKLIEDFAKQNHNDNKAILRAIIALQRLVKNIPAEVAEKLSPSLAEIIKGINDGNLTLSQLNGKMGQILSELSKIKHLLALNDVQNDLIIRLLKKIEEGQELTNEELIQVLELLGNIDLNTDAIKQETEKSNKLLEEIRDLIKGMDESQKAFFEQLIQIAGSNSAELEGIKNLIKFYGTAITQGLGAIFGAINANTMESKNIKALLERILAKMGQMDDNNKAGFQAILDALAGLSAQANNINETNQAGFEAILNALAGIADKLDNIDANNVAKLNIIIQKLQEMGEKIGKGVKVDLSIVEALLAEIKGLNEDQNVKLDTMIDQNNTIIALIEGLKTQVADMDVKFTNKFNEVIQAIKDGRCHCDVSVIIEKLNEVIVILKDNEKPNEGIIGTLDDLIS